MLSLPDFSQKQIIVVALSRGDRLSFKNDNIIIHDFEGAVRHQSTCYRIFSVFIIGHISITSGLLQRAKKFGFSVILLTHGLHFYGSWMSGSEGNLLLRKKQYLYSKLDIARYLVGNKIRSQEVTLQRIRNKDQKAKEAIESLKSYRHKLYQEDPDLNRLLGLEGVSSRLYFQNMFRAHNWIGRKPRAKQDITNLLLDIGYTLLFHFFDALLHLYGFDVYQGVYHQAFYQRKSLVCDLVEPFRVLIDQRLRKAYNLGQIHTADFSVVHGQYRIFGKPSQPYVQLFLEVLLEHKKELFMYVQTYYRSFMQEKDIEEYPVFLQEK